MTVINLSQQEYLNFDNFDVNPKKLLKNSFPNFIPSNWHKTTFDVGYDKYETTVKWVETNTSQRYLLIDTGATNDDLTLMKFIIAFEDEDDMIIFKMLH